MMQITNRRFLRWRYQLVGGPCPECEQRYPDHAQACDYRRDESTKVIPGMWLVSLVTLTVAVLSTLGRMLFFAAEGNWNAVSGVVFYVLMECLLVLYTGLRIRQLQRR